MDTDHVHPGDDWLTARGRTLAHKFPTDQQIDKSLSDFFHKLFGGGGTPGYTPGPRTRSVQTPDGVVHRDPDPDGLLPTDQWKNVPRWSPPAARLPEGWAQYGQGGTGAAPPAVPLNAPKGSVLGEDGLVYSPGSQTGIAPERFKGLGESDPALSEEQMAQLMRQIKNAPVAPPENKGVHYDRPPLNLQFFGHWSDPNTFDERSDPGGIYPDFKKGIPLPSQGPRRVGGGSPEEFAREQAKRKQAQAEGKKRMQDANPGEGWTDAGTLLNNDTGAQMIGLATGDSPYDIWATENKKREARDKSLHDSAIQGYDQSKTPAELQAGREITAGQYPHDFQPGGRFSSLFEQQVPKARRELAETQFARLLGLYDSKGQRTSGGGDTGSARNPVGSADKRLKGKAPVNRGLF